MSYLTLKHTRLAVKPSKILNKGFYVPKPVQSQLFTGSIEMYQGLILVVDEFEGRLLLHVIR